MMVAACRSSESSGRHRPGMSLSGENVQIDASRELACRLKGLAPAGPPRPLLPRNGAAEFPLPPDSQVALRRHRAPAEKHVSRNYSADEVTSRAGRHTASTPDPLGANKGIRGQEGRLVISHRGSRCVPRGVKKGQLSSRRRDFTLLAGGGGSPKACVSEITTSTLSAASFLALMFPLNGSPRVVISSFQSCFKRISPAEDRKKEEKNLTFTVRKVLFFSSCQTGFMSILTVIGCIQPHESQKFEADHKNKRIFYNRQYV